MLNILLDLTDPNLDVLWHIILPVELFRKQIQLLLGAGII